MFEEEFFGQYRINIGKNRSQSTTQIFSIII